MATSANVLVDTSAWVDYFAGDDHIVRALSGPIDDDRVVICGQVKQELLQGTRDEKMFAKLERELSIWSYEAETASDFREAAHLYAHLRWGRVTIPAADCLIAALAKRCGLTVCATDPHVALIPDLRRYHP
jgi:predicted nucleic acid-binding protein